MRPPDFTGTDPRALEVFLDLQRRMSPEQKLALVFELSDMLTELSRQRVRELYPHAGEREVFLRAAARRLDRDTMIRAYGWDPIENDAAGDPSRS